MQFISGRFIIFFLLLMVIIFSRFKFKKGVLLISNIVFYLFSGVKSFVVCTIFFVFTYFGAKVVEKNKNRFVMALILSLSLLPLLFYKYADFIISDVFKISTGNFFENAVVPLGISFFTFQGIGYLIDVFRGNCKAEKNIANYYIFLSLFTCISSGPINRSEALLGQIRDYDKTEFDYERATKGFRYILIGIFMKVLVAGRLSSLAFFGTQNGLALLILSVCYTIQIYCDFCGYSYIAYGLSKIIGIDVIQNFNEPYRSKSVTEFWRRWHISLSSWLKDYVYIPLGGSRCSKKRATFNQIVTFLVSGIWHGANWTFVVWGLLNGIIIVIEKITGYYKNTSSRVLNFLKHCITLATVNVMWIFFSAKTLGSAFNALKLIFTDTIKSALSLRTISGITSFISEFGVSNSVFLQVVAVILIYFIYELIIRKYKEPIEFFESRYTLVRWIKYCIVIFVVLILGTTGEVGGFIYADF